MSQHEPDSVEPIVDTAPATPEQLVDVSIRAEIYLEYTPLRGSGVESLRGTVHDRLYTDMDEHAGTVRMTTEDREKIAILLARTDDEIGVDPGLEAYTPGRGPHPIEMDSIETLEITPPEERP